MPAAAGTFVRLGATIAAAASVLAGKAMIAAGLRRPPEGWRRTVGILLRSESTRFALSAFGLRVPESGLAVPPGRDALPVQNRPGAPGLPRRVSRMRTSRSSGCRRSRIAGASRPWTSSSCGSGTTAGSKPSSHTWRPPVRRLRQRTCVHACTAPSSRATTGRRRRLEDRSARQAAGRRSGGAFVRGFAGATRATRSGCLPRPACRSSRSIRPIRRSASDRPLFAARRTLGFGYLSWVARPGAAPGTVDLWVSAHHVGIDGVPLQDLLERLERAWGAGEIVAFPPPALAARSSIRIPATRPASVKSISWSRSSICRRCSRFVRI